MIDPKKPDIVLSSSDKQFLKEEVFGGDYSVRFNDSDQEVKCYDPDGFSPPHYFSYAKCVAILKKKGKR